MLEMRNGTIMSWQKKIVLALVFVHALVGMAPDGKAEVPPRRKLIVGTKEAPPFSFKNAVGAWRGISIDLWNDIATELNLDYEFRETDLAGLISGVKEGSLDAAVAALTVTPEREEVVDFTHPFHTSGLGIAVVPRKGRWLGVLRTFLSWTFLKIVLGLAFVLLVAGTLVWFFERRRNREQFGGKVGKGLGNAFWWSAVTMTTVGYGDKAPRTTAGRAVAVVWMFTSIVLISGFTAALASVLTTARLESRIQGPEDLPRVRVATVKGTTSEHYLRSRHIGFRPFDSPDAALRAVAAGDVDAVVYDAPILRYLVKERHGSVLHVLPRKFERQDYGIALRSGSDLREPINRVLLKRITDPSWEDTLYRYLGD
jgi:polar amino acid transport system substrate-binding protein